MYIIYNDTETESNSVDITGYDIKAFSIFENTVTIQYSEEIPENNSGFKIYEDNGNLLRDCSNYITKYNISDIGKAIMYSCDGSIETEDNKLDVYYDEISHESALENIFNGYKSDKIAQSKVELAKYLQNNPLISTAHNGVAGTYNVTEEKQNLMMSQYMTYQIEKNINPNAILTWNETGEECEVWTEEEFLQLVLEMKQYVYPMVSYQQSLEKSIKNVTTIEELDAIIIDYGQFNNKDIVEEE